jgi:signal transduction histidine kinase
MTLSESSEGGAPRGALGPEERRTERSIALIRVAVIAVVAVVYLGSDEIRVTARPLAMSILVFAALYAVWSLLARPEESVGGYRFRAGTILVDAALITLWCLATGGASSQYWTLYLIAIVAAAMRFGLAETMAAAVGMALLFVAVMGGGGISAGTVFSRVPVILLSGLALGALAKQRRTHERRRELLEGLAEERSRALAEEQSLVARLRKVDIAKSEFVAVAAHEFRTPLATILGVLGTVRSHSDTLDPTLKDELLAGAQSQAQRLARLVEDLLTGSRIEDGALRLDVQPVHPLTLIQQAMGASRTGDRVRVELNGVDEVRCDADQLVRVLTNLIDNARKYSPDDGTIFVTVSDAPGSVSFSVRDEGPGIPKDRRAEVFDRFRRLADKPDKPGAGLGLYITRCLVEAHGGTIGVDDAPGGGADFHFAIPHPTRADDPSMDRPAAATTV